MTLDKHSRQADDAFNGFPLEIPFPQHIGVRSVKVPAGTSELHIDLEHKHHNSLGMAHGGVVLTLVDVSMAVAATTMIPPEEGDTRTITIELKTTFIGPGHGRLVARGQCIHRTRSMAFCESEVRDEADRIVARGSGTFKYVKAR